jgi:hypothetical protein
LQPFHSSELPLPLEIVIMKSFARQNHGFPSHSAWRRVMAKCGSDCPTCHPLECSPGLWEKGRMRPKWPHCIPVFSQGL